MQSVPVLYEKKILCCGCGVCAAVCPRDAVVMAEDSEGFRYPEIVSEKCVGCRACVAVCPIQKKERVSK